MYGGDDGRDVFWTLVPVRASSVTDRKAGFLFFMDRSKRGGGDAWKRADG